MKEYDENWHVSEYEGKGGRYNDIERSELPKTVWLQQIQSSPSLSWTSMYWSQVTPPRLSGAAYSGGDGVALINCTIISQGHVSRPRFKRFADRGLVLCGQCRH